jgi:transcriptional regulator with XRE-family HTH domain
MADLLGVDQGTVSRWEKGNRKGEMIPRAYLLIYSILDGRPISAMLAERINDDHTGFPSQQKPEEARKRSLRVLAALGLVDPPRSSRRREDTVEEVLIHLLFGALNSNGARKGHGTLIHGLEAVAVRTRTRIGDHYAESDIEAVERAQVIAWNENYLAPRHETVP